ncbi:uncharacterized protein CTRU02_215249 [Colletotrichum truncatum]|uniref:Uncharacterized protein n=1 Tax=Colletotrichum truncatum TaxID=5467 RepID=A0ACC3YDB8_COLTU|nr:uncharacterized protein CTRU02_12291 [Colletotrichum truncatum]KAF6784830.1 hypothetical protein CTRU02_12291 [Colletotrichum truncatum]
MSDPQIYTVGWVCAIATEFTAAQALLDEEYDDPPPAAERDNNSYALGRMGKHHVVITVLPNGEYGKGAAAAAARDMLRSFPNIRIGLMVGIGGGAPSPKHDVRLGDIVVSSRDGGKGGVFGYDFGKTIQNQKQGISFQHTDFLDQPPTVLRTAVSSLRSRYERRGHRLGADVKEALERWPRLQKGYSHPPLDSDKLYRSDIIHPNSPDDCSRVCSNDLSVLVGRVPRGEHDDDPAVHYGLIASGDQVMKNATLRDKLATENGVLCFEMEAAGLMNHFPCMVIRGICDYSDSHKNKAWQGFAAMTAAAYAKDLLRQIQPNKVDEERRLSEIVNSVQQGLGAIQRTADETKCAVLSLRDNNYLTELERWLRPPDTSTNFNSARKKWHQGSGSWFLDSLAYQDWKHGVRRHLWLYGLAGCGKTVLSSTIVANLRSTKDYITLEFYFDFNDVEKQKLDSLLRSLIFQLYSQNYNPQTLHALFTSFNGGKRQADTKSLAACLSKMLNNLKNTYIILDALDECTERNELLEWIKEFVLTHNLRCVYLIATSRTEDVFLRRLPIVIGKECCLSLDKTAIDLDIRSYVMAKLEHSHDFVDKHLSPELLDRIICKVGGGADGMFRWASCQLDSLAACRSPQDIETTLESLPTDLNETYQRMIYRIPSKVRKKAIRLLQFMVHVRQPLTLLEAKDVIATQFDEDPRGFNIKGRPFEGIDVLYYCPGLVSIATGLRQQSIVKEKPEMEFLVLAHFSVKEYLLSGDDFNLTRASVIIARTCLTYLTDICGDFLHLKQHFPLAIRAAEIWMFYAGLAEHSGETTQQAVDFLEDGRRLKQWSDIYQPDDDFWHPDRGPSESSKASGLYYACVAGLKEVTRSLVARGAAIHTQKNGYYGSPIQAAVVGGCKEIVELLLDKGARADMRGSDGKSSLHVASCGGHQRIVQILLDKGAEINRICLTSGTALRAASEQGHQGVVQILLNQGAEVNNEGGIHDSPLIVASTKGHREIVQLLLEKGADINARGLSYSCATHAAAFWGHAEIIRLYISQGAIINVRGGMYGDTPLMAASARGSLEVVKLLLDQKANVNIRGIKGNTPLTNALDGGNWEIAKLLLQKGAAVNVRGGMYGDTPLMAASAGGNLEVVKLLLGYKADVNIGGINGNTPLTSALDKGNWEIAKLLLQKGAAVNVRGGMYGDTPLIAASAGGNLEVVKLLLGYKPNINIGGVDGNTPLTIALDRGNGDLINLLLENGADVNMRGGLYHRTPLETASLKGYQNVVRLLLEKGADLNGQGWRNGSALIAASAGGKLQTVQLLLEERAKVRMSVTEHFYAVLNAENGGYQEIIDLLVDNKASLTGGCHKVANS